MDYTAGDALCRNVKKPPLCTSIASISSSEIHPSSTSCPLNLRGFFFLHNEQASKYVTAHLSWYSLGPGRELFWIGKPRFILFIFYATYYFP